MRVSRRRLRRSEAFAPARLWRGRPAAPSGGLSLDLAMRRGARVASRAHRVVQRSWDEEMPNKEGDTRNGQTTLQARLFAEVRTKSFHFTRRSFSSEASPMVQSFSASSWFPRYNQSAI